MSGAKGDRGFNGIPGKSGKQGNMGPIGPKGYAGRKGQKGERGFTTILETKGEPSQSKAFKGDTDHFINIVSVNIRLSMLTLLTSLTI